MSAKLYIDQEHNALGIIEDHPDGIVTVDHAFDVEDFDCVLGVMERYDGVPRFVGEGTALWRVDAHRQVVLASVMEALRARGYSEDPLDSKAIVTVESERAMRYDRTHREARVAEAVERGLRGHVDLALGVLGGFGDLQLQEVRHTERKERDRTGRPLPLTRARVLLSRPVSEVAEVRAQLREALKPISDILVRASVDEAEDGYEVEVALAPTRGTVSTFVRASLPTFESTDQIRGARLARFILDTAPPADLIASLRERAAVSTAATAISQPNARTVTARVPCTMVEGSPVADRAFGQRVAWIADQLADHGPDLDHVGAVEPVLPESTAEALRMLNEIPVH